MSAIIGSPPRTRSVTMGCGTTGALGREAEAPAAREGREGEDALEPRELLADADARAGAEGEVGELRARGIERAAAREPALGLERVRVGPPARIAMHDPLAHEDDRARGKHVLVDRILLQRATSDDPRRREQSHRLGEHGARVREPREIVRAERVGGNRVDLGVQPALRPRDAARGDTRSRRGDSPSSRDRRAGASSPRREAACRSSRRRRPRCRARGAASRAGRRDPRRDARRSAIRR